MSSKKYVVPSFEIVELYPQTCCAASPMGSGNQDYDYEFFDFEE